MPSPLVIWGASGHARVVAEIVRCAGAYQIVGFLDDRNPQRHGTAFCGATVLGGREQLDLLRARGVEYALFGFGDCAARLAMAPLVTHQGFRFATAIHPSAVIAPDATIGAGTVVCAAAVVNPAARLGEQVIINTGAGVDHECVIADGAHIGPGARLGGRVSIGQAAWVGIGATVKDRVVIGARSIIGAGAVVVKDVPEGVVAYGVPATVVRPVTPDEA